MTNASVEFKSNFISTIFSTNRFTIEMPNPSFTFFFQFVFLLRITFFYMTFIIT